MEFLKPRMAKKENSAKLTKIAILLQEVAESGDVEALLQIQGTAVNYLATIANK